MASKPIKNKDTIEEILPQHDLIYASSSMHGWREAMEDVHTVETKVPGFSNYGFFGVYDGHNGKETANYIGTNLHLNVFKKIRELGEENIEEAIKEAFMQTDSDLEEEEEDNGSGSTAITAMTTPNQIVYVGNVGDSRAVMSVAGLAKPLSEDHKPANDDEKKRIKRAGGYVRHCRLNGDLAVSRSFGDFFYKSNDGNEPAEQIMIAYPDVKPYKIETETDFLVLASDGIWDCKTSQEVIDFINEDVKSNKDLGKACENLMDKCLSGYNSIFEPGCDNMTIIIVGFLHGLKKEQWLERISHR